MPDWLLVAYNLITKPEFCENVISILIMLIVCVIGITFTIFTVIHSFIENRRSLVKSYEQQMRVGQRNPFVQSEIKFGKKYVSHMKRLNTYFLIALCTSVVVLLLTIIEHLMTIGGWYYLFVLSVNILYWIGIIGLFILYIVIYIKTTKHIKIR